MGNIFLFNYSFLLITARRYSAPLFGEVEPLNLALANAGLVAGAANY